MYSGLKMLPTTTTIIDTRITQDNQALSYNGLGHNGATVLLHGFAIKW